uniref:Uncharacterized protein n=1 Tax=Romanomermis culicivorax TaxID=13658 RepID=A0A915KYH0_ROMCU
MNKIGKGEIRKYDQKIKMNSDIEGGVDRKNDRQTENQAMEHKAVIEIKDLAQFIAKLTRPLKIVREECHCRKKSGSITILENYKAEIEKEISEIQRQLRDIQSRKDFPGKAHSGLKNPEKNSHSTVSSEEEDISDFWKKKNSIFDAKISSAEGNNSESILPDFVNDAEKRLRNIDNDTKVS